MGGEEKMGRIIANLKLADTEGSQAPISVDALVDTGATYLTLPYAMKDRISGVRKKRDVVCSLASGSVNGEIFAPVDVIINDFDVITTEVLCVPDCNEVLLGYIPLEAANVAVDMLGHRLVKLNKIDLKKGGTHVH